MLGMTIFALLKYKSILKNMKNSFVLIVALFSMIISCTDNFEEVCLIDKNVCTKTAVMEYDANRVGMTLSDGQIYVQYKIDCPPGEYFLLGWANSPLLNDSLPQIKVAINGDLVDYTFKPSKSGYQNLYLSDNTGEPVAIPFISGENIITIVPVGHDISCFEAIKATLNNTASYDAAEYEEQFSQTGLNAANMYASQNELGTQLIYDVALNQPVSYSFHRRVYIEAGATVSVSVLDVNIPYFIQLYWADINNEKDLVGNTFAASALTAHGSAALSGIQISKSGEYVIRAGSLQPGLSARTTVYYNEDFNGQLTNYTYRNSLLGGLAFWPLRKTGDHYILCNSTNGKNSNEMSLFKSLKYMVKTGGITEISHDGTSYLHDSYLKCSDNVDLCYVNVESSLNPNGYVDIYAGLGSCSDVIFDVFPNAPQNNTFKSGESTGIYNCISWSIERTDYWEWPGDPGSSYYDSNLLYAFDKLYNAYGYTRLGATAENAGIALWAYDNSPGSITHASVRNSENTRYPHGFAWESKCGALERIMHEKDALHGFAYGDIYYYYRPFKRTITQEYSEDEILAIISELKGENQSFIDDISSSIKLDFDTKYSSWKNTWLNQNVSVYSDPKKYTENAEYDELLTFCFSLGNVAWPLCVDKFVAGDDLAMNLLRDVTLPNNANILAKVKAKAETENDGTAPLPPLVVNYLNYCRELLSSREQSIRMQIRDLK